MMGFQPVLIEHLTALIPPDRQAGADENWFDPKQYLGKRGFKYFANSCQYLLAGCEILKSKASIDTFNPIQTGLVIGSNFGLDKTLSGLDAEILEYGANYVSPMMAPNFCINMVPSQASIRFGIHGFNLTQTTPVVAGLDSLVRAARELHTGVVNQVIAGAAEERAPHAQRRYLDGSVTCLVSRAEPDTHGLQLLASYEGFFPHPVPKTSVDNVLCCLRSRFLSQLPEADNVLLLSDHSEANEFGLEILSQVLPKSNNPVSFVLQDSATLEPLLAIKEHVQEIPGHWQVFCCTQDGQFRALHFRNILS